MDISDLKEGDKVYRTYYDDCRLTDNGKFRVVAGVVERITPNTVKVIWDERPNYYWPFREDRDNFGKYFFASQREALEDAKKSSLNRVQIIREELATEEERLRDIGLLLDAMDQ